MSKRPINKKRADRLRKELHRTKPASFIDVYKWLKLRKYAKTGSEAQDLILAGRLQADGKTVGIGYRGEEGASEPYALAFLDSDLIDKLEVVDSTS